MDNDIFRKYMKAGKIAGRAREKSREWAKQGVLLLELANKIESFIRDNGGEIAFPVNLSLNEIGAHYTPSRKDKTKIKENDVLKIDIGTQIDGYIGDTAVTVCFNDKYNDMAKANKEALEKAMELCKPGTPVDDISNMIENTIKAENYKPIRNLTGHGLEHYNLHAKPTIPNVSKNMNYVLEEDDVIAIEPFATDGKGKVVEGDNVLVYALLGQKNLRSINARKVASFAQRFNGLPFAQRWIPMDSMIKARLGLKGLKRKGMIREYPVLKQSKGIISQFEHTVIVREEPIITTEVTL